MIILQVQPPVATLELNFENVPNNQHTGKLCLHQKGAQDLCYSDKSSAWCFLPVR